MLQLKKKEWLNDAKTIPVYAVYKRHFRSGHTQNYSEK